MQMESYLLQYKNLILVKTQENIWSTLAGLEPAISGVGNRRLIH